MTTTHQSTTAPVLLARALARRDAAVELIRHQDSHPYSSQLQATIRHGLKLAEVETLASIAASLARLVELAEGAES